MSESCKEMVFFFWNELTHPFDWLLKISELVWVEKIILSLMFGTKERE